MTTKTPDTHAVSSALADQFDLLTEAQVATLLGLTVRGLRAKRLRGDGPTATIAGRKIMYQRVDVRAYLAACRVVPQTMSS